MHCRPILPAARQPMGPEHDPRHPPPGGLFFCRRARQRPRGKKSLRYQPFKSGSLMTPVMTVSEAMIDPALLGGQFAGPSWSTWRAVLRAAEGLPLDDDDLALFRSVADRDPPRRRVRELHVIAGRRAGKDSVASAIAAVAAIQDYSAYLRPGERASVICLAVDRAQARIVLRYIAGYFRENPLLAPLVTRWTDDGLELSNNVEIVVVTNSFRAIRGRTVASPTLDEIAFWRDEAFANPAAEVYSALLPAMVTIPSAMLIAISTPYRKSGLLYSKWQRHYAQDDDDVLVVKGASRTFNPLLPEALIEAALARDPEAAAAEWLGEWRSDLSDFIDRALVESLVVPGRRVLAPLEGVTYSAFADPSGGSADAMTLAIAHRERNGRHSAQKSWPRNSPPR
jgi:hypothetical protein